jgi:histidinol-phosphatase (PHP family)
MPVLADYHVHTPLCQHATGPMEDYVERAIELGLEEIGFSDHNPLPNGLSSRVRMTEDQLDYYVQSVRDLQFRYHGKIQVLLGLELDYVEGLEPYLHDQVNQYPWDYVIGSIHHLDPACETMSWPRNYEGDVHELYARYFGLMRQLVHSGLCDIIAHFDVPKRSGRFPGSSEQGLIEETLDAIAAAGLCMEINTSGYRHAELPEPQPYPSLDLARLALDRGIPLTVNSDAHAPHHVGMRFVEVADWLKRNGCLSLVRFSQRRREACRL